MWLRKSPLWNIKLTLLEDNTNTNTEWFWDAKQLDMFYDVWVNSATPPPIRRHKQMIYAINPNQTCNSYSVVDLILYFHGSKAGRMILWLPRYRN